MVIIQPALIVSVAVSAAAVFTAITPEKEVEASPPVAAVDPEALRGHAESAVEYSSRSTERQAVEEVRVKNVQQKIRQRLKAQERRQEARQERRQDARQAARKADRVAARQRQNARQDARQDARQAARQDARQDARRQDRQSSTPTGVGSSGGGGGGGLNWAALRNCESGGNYSTNTGNGYYGAYQFSLSTWRAVGGSGYPHQNSAAEQDLRARILLQSSGDEQWPVCGDLLYS